MKHYLFAELVDGFDGYTEHFDEELRSILPLDGLRLYNDGPEAWILHEEGGRTWTLRRTDFEEEGWLEVAFYDFLDAVLEELGRDAVWAESDGEEVVLHVVPRAERPPRPALYPLPCDDGVLWTFDAPAADVSDDFVARFVEVVAAELEAGRKVRLNGFGTLVARVRPGRRAVLPDGQPITMPAQVDRRFKPGAELREAINGNGPMPDFAGSDVGDLDAASIAGLLSRIVGEVEAGPVRLPGLGRFQLKHKKAATGRHPITGQTIEIPATKLLDLKFE